MYRKNLLKANLKRLRLLRFSSFTLGGAGLEGSYLSTMAVQDPEKKKTGDFKA